MSRGKSFTIQEIGKIQAYKECGLSTREIARQVQRSHIRVANVLHLGASYGKTRRPGRTPMVTSRQKRDIIRKASSKKTKFY